MTTKQKQQSERLTEKYLKGIEAHMEDHLREAAEAHMGRLIAEVRWYLAHQAGKPARSPR